MTKEFVGDSVAELYFVEPHIGYFQRRDVEYKDDVRRGLFIHGTVIDLTTGRICGFNEIAAVKFLEDWIDMVPDDLDESLEYYIGFPYNWDDEEGN